jgi:hypothetical protein
MLIGEERYSSTLSLTLVLDGWSVPRPGRFTRRERPGTRRIGGWVGPGVGLDGRGKSCPQKGFDPRSLQSRDKSI